MADPIHILVVDDEPSTRELLSISLSRDGFKVSAAASGSQALRLAYQEHPDAILLDVRMPGMDGFEVCRRLREMTDAVIVFVTVTGSKEDVVRGLEVGADDYVVKPYTHDEVVARVRACLRRRSRDTVPATLRLPRGEALLVADSSRRLIFIDDGHTIQLTPKEFELLHYLARHQGRVLSAEAILANVWGREYAGERELVKQLIYRLRSKLEPDPANPRYILTVRGSGYTFEEDTHPARQPPSEQQYATPSAHPSRQEAGPSSVQAQPRAMVMPSHRLRSDTSTSDGGKTAHRPLPRARPWAVSLLFLAILATVCSVSLSTSSADALPGDPLHPVKTGLQVLRVVTAGDDAALAQVHLQIASIHLDEAEKLVRQRRSQDLRTSIDGFESHVHGAVLSAGNLVRAGNSQAAAIASMVEDAIKDGKNRLETLRLMAPEETWLAIGHGLDALQAEADTIKALIHEGEPIPVGGDSRSVATAEATNSPMGTGSGESGITPTVVPSNAAGSPTATLLPTRVSSPPSTEQPPSGGSPAPSSSPSTQSPPSQDPSGPVYTATVGQPDASTSATPTPPSPNSTG